MHTLRLLGTKMTECMLGGGLVIVLALGGAGCSAQAGDADSVEEDGDVASATQPILFNGHDYLFFLSAKTWAQAQAVCQQQGNYHLAVPNDVAEQAFLHSEEASRGGLAWWIGITDQGTEGFWTQGVGGPRISIANWNAANPNNQNNNEDCGIDFSFTDGSWNDYGCGNTARFVCESGPTAGAGFVPFAYSAVNTNSATVAAVNMTGTIGIPVNLNAGQTITLGTCGLVGATNSGDTFLRLKNQLGQEVASNDDACGGVGSNISYVASSSGTYTIRAGCFQNNSCSGNVTYSVR